MLKSNPEYIVLNRGFYVLSQTQPSQQVDNEVHKRFRHFRRVCKVTVCVVHKGSCVISLVADLHTTKQTNAHTRRGHYRFKTLRTHEPLRPLVNAVIVIGTDALILARRR